MDHMNRKFLIEKNKLENVQAPDDLENHLRASLQGKYKKHSRFNIKKIVIVLSIIAFLLALIPLIDKFM